MTNSISGDGVGKLIEAVDSHFEYLNKEGGLAEKVNDRYQRQVKSIVLNRYENYLWKDESKNSQLEKEISKRINKRLSPNQLADLILENEEY